MNYVVMRVFIDTLENATRDIASYSGALIIDKPSFALTSSHSNLLGCRVLFIVSSTLLSLNLKAITYTILYRYNM